MPATPRLRFALVLLVLAPAGLGASIAVAQEPAMRPTIMAGPSADREEPGESEGDGLLPGVLPEDDGAVREPDAARSRRVDGLRPAVQDGDPPPEEESALLRDGVIEVGEPDPAPDGADPAAFDQRTPEEVAAFDNPPAPDDALLFQIEELEPVADRRTRRLFVREPFDPVGIRVGSFVLFPEAETYGQWSSNVLRAPSAQSDVSWWLRPSARLVSDWRVHALELRAEGTLSSYAELSSEDERGYGLEARGRLDVTRRTNLQGGVQRTVGQESRSAIDAAAAGERAQVTTDRVALAATHRFNRLTLQLRGALTDTDYSDVVDNGVTVSNADRDVRQSQEAVRASWELKPTLSLFAEVGLDQRRHDAPAQSDGLIRDSDGERYRVGVSFGETGAWLRGEASVGYGRQEADETRLGAVDGFLFDANLAWRVSELTSVLLTGRSEIEDTTTAGSPGAMTREIGIEARHALRRYLIASAGLDYLKRDFAGVPIDEREIRARLGIEYFLAREAVVFGRYQHTDFASDQPASDYTDDELRIGLRLRR